MEYKKSYFGFWMWLIGFCGLYTLCCFLPKLEIRLLIAILDNIMSIGIFILTLIIYITEKIYWYNSTDYETALNAGSERRKAFAMAHMKRFGGFAALYLVYSIISILTGIPYGIDITVAVIGTIVAALSTISIKL